METPQTISYPRKLRHLGDMTLIQKGTHLFEITNTKNLSIVLPCLEIAKKVMLYMFFGSIERNNKNNLK